MRFYKAHGLGNDFVLLWEDEAPRDTDWGRTAITICDRHTGIGADGILLLSPCGNADFFMSVYNSDGSRAQMCGNGIRCAALTARLSGRAAGDEMTVDTLSGLQRIRVDMNGADALVTVNMGQPVFTREALGIKAPDIDPDNVVLTSGGEEVTVHGVFMGVPHGIVFTDDVSRERVAALGPGIEKHPVFSEGINADFVRVEEDGSLTIRTWERGAGPTLACGTGACAAAVIHERLTGAAGPRVVRPLLGAMTIERRPDGVYMTGPAQIVCTGDVDTGRYFSLKEA